MRVFAMKCKRVRLFFGFDVIFPLYFVVVAAVAPASALTAQMCNILLRRNEEEDKLLLAVLISRIQH